MQFMKINIHIYNERNAFKYINLYEIVYPVLM